MKRCFLHTPQSCAAHSTFPTSGSETWGDHSGTSLSLLGDDAATLVTMHWHVQQGARAEQVSPLPGGYTRATWSPSCRRPLSISITAIFSARLCSCTHVSEFAIVP